MKQLPWAVAITLSLLPVAAHAGLVGPGETASLNASDVAAASGTLLAEKSSPFTIDYGTPEPALGFTGTLTGSLHSSVYKEGGKLTFIYDIDVDGDGAAEGTALHVASFAKNSTLLTGALDFQQFASASRSADGSELSLFSSTPGLGGAPLLMVKTDATSYDTKGFASFFASDEVPTVDGSRTASGTAEFNGVFEPSNAGPTPIPLPPAAYSGMGVLLAMVLVFGFRRMWTVRGA